MHEFVALVYLYSNDTVILEEDVLPFLCLLCIFPATEPLLARPILVHLKHGSFFNVAIRAGLDVVVMYVFPSLFNSSQI